MPERRAPDTRPVDPRAIDFGAGDANADGFRASDARPEAPRKRRHPLVRRFVAIVVVLLLIPGGYVAYNYVRFVLGITHVNALVPTAGDMDGKDQNILLVGDDHRPAGATAAQLAQLGTTQDGGGTSTDTMIILHIPANGNKATMISFPRDSWVNIPGFGMNKLNSAFALGSAKGGDAGGAQLLVRTIQNLTGLTVNHYVRVSLLGFYNVVKALGPVSVCLNHAVSDPYSGINLPAGVSRLNAQQALAFVRQRHGLANGDLDREVRQQYFLSIEAQQILTAGTLLNPGKLQNVIDAVSSSIETDPDLNLLSLAARLKGFGSGNITSATIPVEGTPTIRVNGRAVSIVQINAAGMPAFVRQIIRNDKSTAKPAAPATPPVVPAAVTVAVQNGSGVNGAASVASNSFARFGFHTVTPTTTTAHATTTVEYPSGDKAQAQLVALYVPGSTLAASSTVSQVTVILGADHLVVKSPQPATPTAGSSGAATASPKVYSSASCIN